MSYFEICMRFTLQVEFEISAPMWKTLRMHKKVVQKCFQNYWDCLETDNFLFAMESKANIWASLHDVWTCLVKIIKIRHGKSAWKIMIRQLSSTLFAKRIIMWLSFMYRILALCEVIFIFFSHFFLGFYGITFLYTIY